MQIQTCSSPQTLSQAQEPQGLPGSTQAAQRLVQCCLLQELCTVGAAVGSGPTLARRHAIICDTVYFLALDGSLCLCEDNN
jgi:hypothetical protein